MLAPRYSEQHLFIHVTTERARAREREREGKGGEEWELGREGGGGVRKGGGGGEGGRDADQKSSTQVYLLYCYECST
jgi:hypothetical protein